MFPKVGVLTVFSPSKAPRKPVSHVGHRAAGRYLLLPGKAGNSEDVCDILARPQAMSTIRTSPNLEGEQNYN